jgi:hypothetical protein
LMEEVTPAKANQKTSLNQYYTQARLACVLGSH